MQDVVLGDLDLVQVERAHRLRQQHHAGDDRGRAAGIQADHRPSLRFVHVGEAREQQFDRGQQQRIPVHALGIVGIELLVDRRGRRRGAGHRDATRTGARSSVGQPGLVDAPTSAASSCRSAERGGSPWMWRSLIRTTPAGSET